MDNGYFMLKRGDALPVEFTGESPGIEFRLLKPGENEMTQRGKDKVLTVTAEHLRTIAEYQKKKGEKIPIDSRHALFLAARKADVTEDEALRQVPQQVAALAFCALEARPDGLYAVDVETTPLARELFKNGSLKYYSPVIRGLDGSEPLKITSIAMDNVPALNDLDGVIAASDTIEYPPTQRKEFTMNSKTEAALRKVFGDDALVLSDTTDDAVADKILALGAELPTLRSKAARTDELESVAETAKREGIISRAMAEGKISESMKPALMKLDTVALSDLMDATPKAKTVPVEGLPKPPEDEKKPESVITPEEQKVAKSLGLSDEEFTAAKKACENEGCK